MLAGVFLVYHALAPALRALIWLTKFSGPIMPSDVVMSLGFPVLLAAVGCLFIARRQSLAQRLLSDTQSESEESEAEPLGVLASMFTATGMLLFTYGFVHVVELITEWLLSTSSPDPAEVWPYRVSSIVEVSIGYVLLFRSPSVTSWVLSRQTGHSPPPR